MSTTQINNISDFTEVDMATSKEFSNLVLDAIEWGESRGILPLQNHDRFCTQFLKLVSEFGELTDALGKNRTDKREMVIDAIGDMCVVLSMLDHYYLSTCLQVDRDKLIQFAVGEHEKRTDDEIGVRLYGYLNDILLHVSRPLNGRVLYLLDALARRHDSDITQCFKSALEIINKRKGKMINGVFVKEGDY